MKNLNNELIVPEGLVLNGRLTLNAQSQLGINEHASTVVSRQYVH